LLENISLQIAWNIRTVWECVERQDTLYVRNSRNGNVIVVCGHTLSPYLLTRQIILQVLVYIYFVSICEALATSPHLLSHIWLLTASCLFKFSIISLVSSEESVSAFANETLCYVLTRNSTVYCAEVITCLMKSSCPKTNCQNETPCKYPCQPETRNIVAQSFFAVSEDILH
jgi:hypothetical protein